MDHSVSPVFPTPVHRDTIQPSAPRQPETPPRNARRLPIATCALLLAMLMVTFAPGHAAAQESGPYNDGCYYLSQGGQWTLRRCPQPDGSNYVYAPGDNGWDYIGECMQTELFTACLSVDFEYTESYSDGSWYRETPMREYVINHVDGSVAEAGYYDPSGVQKVYRGMSTMKNSAAMRNRSMMYWYYHGLSVQTVVNSNPSAFRGLITMNPASNDYVKCLQLHDSSKDLDYDGRTGFNELADFCTAQAFS